MPPSEGNAGRKRRERSLEDGGPSAEEGDQGRPRSKKKATRRVSLDVEDDLEAEIIRELEGNVEEHNTRTLETEQPQREKEDAPRKAVTVEGDGHAANETKLKGDIAQRLTPSVMSVQGNN